MGINHISITVADIDKARAFYTAALAPLGYKEQVSFADCKVLVFGAWCGPEFWIVGPNAPSADGSDVRHTPEGPSSNALKAAEKREPTGPMHIAFDARNRQQVRDFHKAAMYVHHLIPVHLKRLTASYFNPDQCGRRSM